MSTPLEIYGEALSNAFVAAIGAGENVYDLIRLANLEFTSAIAGILKDTPDDFLANQVMEVLVPVNLITQEIMDEIAAAQTQTQV